ncbi:P-loop containing nucleoside triphosphate hydrolase protein [Rhypophila decipiens]|uniref:P-loop containing nucleoside triphosphate hydrolase protein n=1 Tax=Rhypophila decipiens TaxID=261697 RepID=A0AAN6XZF9_9PEZI|nr:P-loop containing nucleoside triphosphate hydrolase protein [Rhypophila decipiens]
MATTSSHNGGEGKSNEERNASILKGPNDEILHNLEKGKLDENDRVILIIGPTGAGKTTLLKLISGCQELRIGETLQAGTIHCYCVSVKFGEQNFVFIDTPGFGYQGETKKQVKKLICGVVGLFTRELKGIHGILYVRDIREERVTTGDHDCLTFLREIAPPTKPNQLLDRLVFLTSHWDTLSDKSRRKAETRETELVNNTWSEFQSASPLGVDLGEDPDAPERIQEERERVVREILSRYRKPGHLELDMPFIETNAGRITITIVEGVLKVTLATGIIVAAVRAVGAVAVTVIPPAFKFILKYGYIVSDGGAVNAGLRFSA